VSPAFPISLFALFAAAVFGQDFTDLKVERVAGGYAFTEGPVWSHDGFLIFSDIPSNKLLQFKPGAPSSVFRTDTNGANGNTYDVQGRLYSCESHSRRVTRADKKGKIEVLAERFQGKRLNAPNDIAVRKDGHIYFTDPAFGNQQDTRELDFYGVYHLSNRGELEVVAKPKGRPNGIAISPNGRILYVTNSDDRNVRAYDLDRNGAASSERVLVSNIEGVPDGIRVDKKGNIYGSGPGGVWIISPEGKHLGTIKIPEVVSNVAWGDKDGKTLYITASTSLYRIKLSAQGVRN